MSRMALALFFPLLGLLAVLPCTWAQAQSTDPVPERIAAQREQLAQQRQQIMGVYEQQARDCWQKFAVNACLSKARQARRAALDPVHQEELTLNAQERAWRTEQRTLRLEGKKPENPSSTGRAAP